MAACCGIWPVVFGGWSERCCELHDAEYRLMYAGKQTKTLDEVDGNLLACLLERAKKGPLPTLQTAQAYAMYGIAHAWGLVRWKGPR